MKKTINALEGVLPLNKPEGKTAFSLVRLLRKHLQIQKIGHAGTLDPFATGVMVMLIGRRYTRLSDLFLNEDKEYTGRIHLGIVTDTYDCEGKILSRSEKVPELDEIDEVIKTFQGEIQQVPPMYSAKKQKGKKLYQLARQGQTVERKSIGVHVEIEVLDYTYPFLDIRVNCSKGTYIRALAHDVGVSLGCGAHLSALMRTRSGKFYLSDCLSGERLECSDFQLEELSARMCTSL